MDSESQRTLPTELLLSVIDQVESAEDLLLLATASRQFHHLSVRAYFSRNGFDPTSKNLSLNSFDRSLKCLRGLAISLDVVGTSIDYLSHDFGYVNDRGRNSQEIRLLTRYVAKLSSIKQVSLRLEIDSSESSKEWRTASITLLSTILQKSCTNIHITTSQLKSFYEEKESPRSRKPSNWFKNYWPDGIEPPTTDVKHLRVCFIQTFPTFLRPFYYHTLRSNASVLTDLSFKNLFGGGADWATMMAIIHFPRLSRLTIIYGVIPKDPLIKFLTKHQTIKEFEYHHIRYDPRPKRPAHVGKSVFECLHTLDTTPEHILNFLPSMAKMPALINIIIKIEELVTNFSALEGALRCLASCVNRITLALQITRTGLGFGAWLDTIVRNGLNASRRPESLLHCVETLIIDNGEWGFLDEYIFTRLPAWLRLFPALRALTLRDGSPAFRAGYASEESSDDPPTFLDALKDACPGIYIEWYHDRHESFSARA